MKDKWLEAGIMPSSQGSDLCCLVIVGFVLVCYYHHYHQTVIKAAYLDIFCPNSLYKNHTVFKVSSFPIFR
jgi:hypothetical protein